MGFEVPRERVGRRRAVAPAIGVIVGMVAIVVAGLVFANGQGPAPSTADAVAVQTPAGSIAVAGPSASPGHAELRAPGTIVCNDVDTASCQRIVNATVLRLVDAPGPATEIGVWKSLMCRDTSDCPAYRLVGSRLLGSAVVTFGSGHPTAWVNVVEPGLDPTRDQTQDPPSPGPVAWIIRWLP